MNANDHVPMVNIMPFGFCKKGMPCMPVTPVAWVDVNKKHIIDGAPALTEDSKLACAHGGVITIVPLDAGSAEEGKMNEIVESAVEKVGLALKMAGAIADCIDVFSPGGLVKMAGKKGAAKKLKGGGNKGKGNSDKSGEVGGGNDTSKAGRVYVPNPKHDTPGGNISPNPFGNNVASAKKSLKSAYSSSTTKQLYNVHEGKLVKFQPDNAGGYHPYEVINPAREVPANVLRQMKNNGLISSIQYNKWLKNK